MPDLCGLVKIRTHKMPLKRLQTLATDSLPTEAERQQPSQCASLPKSSRLRFHRATALVFQTAFTSKLLWSSLSLSHRRVLQHLSLPLIATWMLIVMLFNGSGSQACGQHICIQNVINSRCECLSNRTTGSEMSCFS